MNLNLQGRIGEQHAAYRKGLVLGLTMAEVGILIIFVLLLLIAAEQIRHDRALQGKTLIAPDRLHELESAEGILQELASTLKIESTRPKDDFKRLVRIVASVAADSNGENALSEARQQIDGMKAALQQVQKVLGSEQAERVERMAGQVEMQSYRLANQEGQLRNYEKQLEAAGQGKGERPCWVQPDGKIDYLYDVVLTSDGIRMREYDLPHRSGERALLPMPKVDPSEVLSPGEFLRRTTPLYDSSLAENCRFFVVIYDATASHEKSLYKSLLKTVESHFYKRLSEANAPF